MALNMKYILLLLFTFSSLRPIAQNRNFHYYNPAKDPVHLIEGQGWPDEAANSYDRLPERIQNQVRKPVWDLSKNSAGLQLHFETDAPEIVIKYVVSGQLQMPHMPATGVSGVDLYAQDDDGNWLWAAGRFSFGDTITYRYNNLNSGKREYTLYFPLYNTVRWMEIGVPENNHFTPLPLSKKKPVIVYGTSIAQGACASRPGLAWTNILSRKLNRPVINLGFSGNGRLETPILNLLTELDAAVYVLDCLPNMTTSYMPTDTLKQRLTDAFVILRSAKPFIPILFTEHDGYAGDDLNNTQLAQYTEANQALDEVFDSLQKAGMLNIYLLKKEAIAQGIETTVDGTHPNDIGMMHYAEAYDEILGQVFKVNQRTADVPSIIPRPQQLTWKQGFFNITTSKGLLLSGKAATHEVKYLQNELSKMGLNIPIISSTRSKSNLIEILMLNGAPSSAQEEYQLSIKSDKIILSASNPHGVFNGIQTLLQLVRQTKNIPACEIKDHPAFAWRGYMIDVGRNFMSMDLLKQQIDVMARYKLNVFHFHPTEDIAWRFAIKRYPQLTAASTMLRDKGMFYSQKDIHDLIQYCKERHIIFLPEIDMPGHSAAFKRAMGVDMQSDSGVVIVKNILKEICTTYDIPYIHIGADEVKITNEQFIPEVTKWIESFGKKVIGWQPGGNFTQNTIRQLWMEDKSHLTEKGRTEFIDSRHLYLNHMAPLEAVTTIFNREIGDEPKGNATMIGATLCTWNDRRAAKEIDILRMNPVYPGMMAFAERCWDGGGQPGWISNVSDGSISGFKAFEKRMLTHKGIYFQDIPFPYVKQTPMRWQILGPYENEGVLGKEFTPELSSDPQQWKYYKKEIGGTVVLRHWWYPLIKGAIDNPAPNTTYYAHTKLWSDKDTIQNFWIGFYNISRSQATDSPPAGHWDYKQSEAWINGRLIAPPKWNHPGMPGDMEIPLSDEGCEYRAPTKIEMKKGWNEILLKCPVGSFQGKNWNNPVKWMFTFVPSP